MATTPIRVASRRVVLPAADGGLEVAPALLTIEGTLIREVQRLDEGTLPAGTLPAGALPIGTMDFGERWLTPAFINAHTHLALGFLRGVGGQSDAKNLVEDLFFHYESKIDEADVRAFARIGAYESLLHGVGLVWDHYYFAEAFAEALLDTGLAGVIAPTLQDLAGPGAGCAERAFTATERIARSERHRRGGVFAALGPHATDTVSGELMRRAAEFAGAEGLPLHVHCAQSVEELERVLDREGKSPVEYLEATGALDVPPSTLLIHNLFVSEADLRRLDASRHALGFCPFSQLVFGFPAPVDRWSEAGIPWFVATDCAASNDSMSVQKELRFTGARAISPTSESADYQRFLATGRLADAQATWGGRMAARDASRDDASPATLLSRVWSIPGRLHPSFVAGVIAPGALANIVVWDPDHPSTWPPADPLRTLAMADTSAAIHAMFVAGRQVGQIGDFAASLVTSDDYREAADEAQSRFAALIG